MQTNEIRREPITEASAWKGKDLRGCEDQWREHWTAEELADLDRALQGVKTRGLGWGCFGRDDFPLGAAAARVRAIDEQLERGRGFVLLRGLPVASYSLADIKAIYWGLSSHLGQIIVQNVKGGLMEHIEDIKVANLDDPSLRGYVTSKGLDAHSDNSDTVILLCVDRAEHGGRSAIISTTAIHNKVMAERPDLLPALYDSYRYDLRGEGVTGDANETSEPVPVFHQHGGRVRSWFHRRLILGGAAKAGIELSALQREALDYFADAAHDPELVLEHDLQPGDMQFLNNYLSVHFRTPFEDGPHHKRLLLRLWYNRTDRSQVDPVFENSWIVSGYKERDWARAREVAALGVRR